MRWAALLLVRRTGARFLQRLWQVRMRFPKLRSEKHSAGDGLSGTKFARLLRKDGAVSAPRRPKGGMLLA